MIVCKYTGIQSVDGAYELMRRGGDTLDDTLGVLEDVTAEQLEPNTVARLVSRDGPRMLHGFVFASAGALLYRATAPGPPGSGRKRCNARLRPPPLGSP